MPGKPNNLRWTLSKWTVLTARTGCLHRPFYWPEMPDTEITTKPFVSRAQAGWAFATGQPWARRWARETGSYKKLPKRKRLKAVCTCTKETLAPGVTRIRGNLCNVHGRWGACDKAGQSNSQRVAPKQLPKAPKPKAGGRGKRSAGGKGRVAAKPKRTPEQRRAETEAAHAQKLSENRQKVADAMAAADAGLSPSGSKALLDFADGKPLDSATADGLAKMGLVEIGKDGQPRLSQAGRATVAAMNRGDVRGALDAIGRGSDRIAQQAEAERKRQEREAEKKKKGKGGGGKSKKPPQPRAPLLPRSSSATSRTPQVPRAGGAGSAKPTSAQPQQLSPELQRAVQTLSEGRPLDEAATDLLIRNGLARRNRDGELYLTAAGQRAMRTKSFAVFKDASGAWRWIARTTTAFEDRDQEVISTKALEADAARADADGLYGPLRWWHMGRPSPLSTKAPWGAGVDLGWCDFNAVCGRTLIESGTFKSRAIAQAVAAKADELELSPGFFHAAGEPDASGVFHHIRRFERSLVPKWAGRASNPYTGLVVEKAMDPKKVEALKALGLDEATLKSVLADVEQTEKEAEAEGVRYKDHSIKDFFVALLKGESPGVTAKEAEMAAEAIAKTPPPPPPDPLVALKAQIAALTAEVAVLKAPLPPPDAEDAAEPPEMPGEAPDAEDLAEGPEETGGLTLSTDDLAAIGQVIGSVLQAALEPLIGAMGITQKLDGHMGELKALMGGFVKQKDDSEAARAQEIATLKARLDELVGDQPRGGYRPTQAPDNAVWANPQIQAAIKDAAASGNGFEDLTAQLFPGILPSN